MSLKTAKIISIIGHPVFIPIYALIVIFKFHPVLGSRVYGTSQFNIIIVFSGFLSLIPLFATMMLLGKATLKQLAEINQTERIKASFVMSVVYILAYFYLRQQNFLIEGIIEVLIFALCIGSCVLGVMSYFKKISFHAFGWAGLLTLMIVLGRSQESFFLFWVLAILFVSAIVITSRLVLNAHTHSEVYLGFFVGLISNIAVYLLFNGKL
ncbi:MAG: hypothetical protein H6607_13380 [Flavobacteriales bacterium]|nr:hypothetical protein [Flavobacteriales bacterium]